LKKIREIRAIGRVNIRVESNLRVSIITVCLNSEYCIRETIESVLKQSYRNIDYVIIDGLSKDNTVQIIKEYEPLFEGKLTWISKIDKGIYNAFNKGIKLSKGEILFFLNAGDYFIDPQIVEETVDIYKQTKVDILIGDVSLGNRQVRKNNVSNIYGLMFRTICHQSFFSRRVCFENNLFDERYRWLSDYAWVIKCFKNKSIKKMYWSRIVCFFDPSNNTGYDDLRLLRERYRERMEIGLNHFKGLYKVVFFINQLRLNLKLFIAEKKREST